jgi:hypothetical protein
VQRSLASLALNPKISIVLFINTHFLLPFNVDHFFLLLTSITKYLCIISKNIFATETSLFYYCKLAKTRSCGHLGNKNVPSMLSAEEQCFCVRKNRLKNPQQWLFYLVINIELVVNGKIILQHIKGIL